MKLSATNGRSAILSFAFALWPLLAATAQAPVRGPISPYAPDRVLVAFKETAAHNSRLAAVAKAGLQVDGAAQNEYFVRLKITPTQLATGLDVKRAIAKLKTDPAVRIAEPDWIVRGQEFPNDPLFPEQWSLYNFGQNGFTVDADIDAPEAWDITLGNSSLKVAVIDSGVDYTHEDLAANILRDAKGRVVGYDYVNLDADPMDDLGHGTHVAGTIGAVQNNGIGISGICPLVKIMPLKFLNADNWGWLSDAILSVDFARTHGARIMNNSWGGGGYSQLLLDAILRARSAGILFVVSAMNDRINIDADPMYPASYNGVADNVISVAASNRSDNIASFSNFGPTTVDIAAPGSYILSTVPGNRYEYYNGTSMAAPHVAGTAALVLASYPTLKYWQVKARLMANVDHPAGVEGMVKSGRLNAASALVSDTILPSAPRLFGATQRAAGALRLQWTAGGDDGKLGRASFYDLRFSTSPITGASFLNSARVEGVPTPAPSGTVQSVVKMGLAPGTTYYFALRSIDKGGNFSGIVNATVTTLPDALTTTLLEDNGEGAALFTGDAPWTSTTEDAYGPTHSYTDSEGALYTNNLDISLTQTTAVYVPADQAPTLSFWVKYDLEYYFDRLNVEVSTDDGTNWRAVGGVTWNSGGEWVHMEVPLTGFGGTFLKTRFRLITDADDVADGVHLDDIQIRGEQFTDYYLAKLAVVAQFGTPGTAVKFKGTLKRLDNSVPIAGKQVDFYDAATNAFLGFGISDTTGGATIELTAPASGVQQEITLKFAGDASFAPCTATGTLTGGNMDARLYVPDVNGTIYETLVLKAKLTQTNGSGIYGARITFKVNGVQVRGTAITGADGWARLDYYGYPSLAGTNTIEAFFGGTVGYHAVTGTGTLYIHGAWTTSITVESVTGTAGTTIPLSATLRRSDGVGAYNVNLNFYVDNLWVGHEYTNASGRATINYLIPGSMAVGTHVIKVEYSGYDGKYKSSSGTGTLTVN